MLTFATACLSLTTNTLDLFNRKNVLLSGGE
jgi:hypothetical protein